MVTAENLKKEIGEIKTRVNPEPKHLILDFNFSSENEPHGFLNGSLFHLLIGKDGKEAQYTEAINSETELKSNRVYYDALIFKSSNKFMKQSTHPFYSFESFVEYHRCKCGKHGPDNKQPYLGECP